MNEENKNKIANILVLINQEISDKKWPRIKAVYLKKETLIIISAPLFDSYDEDDVYFDTIKLFEDHFEIHGIHLTFEGDSFFNNQKRYYSITNK